MVRQQDFWPHLSMISLRYCRLAPQVDLGPFKHTVDDGLDLRKAAFECMETLLARAADRLEFGSFLMHLLDGLRDDSDIFQIRPFLSLYMKYTTSIFFLNEATHLAP